MAKGNTKGMHGKTDRKARGRTNIGGTPVNGDAGDIGPRSTRPNVPRTMRAEATRPQSPGGTKHRGDRRDTNKLYTNNAKHPARGSNARPDVSTRKR